MTYSTSERWR